MKEGDLARIVSGTKRKTHKRFIGELAIVTNTSSKYITVSVIGMKVKFYHDEIELVKKCP